jgi:hypothetical protein
MAGCNDDSLCRLGNWNQTNALDGCYLWSLPRNALHSIAGFTPIGHVYELDCAAVTPPEDLQKLSFPDVEFWLNRQYNGDVEANLATVGFLNLLQKLCTILLKDLVQLKAFCPCHPMWSHSIFECAMYEHFENELQQLLSNDNVLPTTSLCSVVPELLNAMEISHGSLSTRMEGLIQSNAKLEWVVENLYDDFHEIMTGHAAIHLHIDRNCGSDGPNSVQNADILNAAALHCIAGFPYFTC